MKTLHTDVLIVGGGVAGIAAALACAKEGGKALLIEQQGFFGGMATSASVGTICGMFLCTKDGPFETVLNGVLLEFCERIQHLSHSTPQRSRQGLTYLPYHPFAFAQTIQEYLCKEPALSLLLHSTVSSIQFEQTLLTTAKVLSAGEGIDIEYGALIDASGHAITTAVLPHSVVEAEKEQAYALSISYQHDLFATEEELRILLTRAIIEGIHEGVLPRTAEKISVVPGSVMKGEFSLKVGIYIPEAEYPLRGAKITQAELEARRLSFLLTEYLSSRSKFSSLSLIRVSPHLGIRTGRRPKGRHLLTRSEVVAGTSFSDVIAKGSWPIEEWYAPREPLLTFLEKNSYDIPARSLQSAEYDNLFFAGRCMSADEGAIASARVIGTCLQTGWAAGKLALKAL